MCWINKENSIIIADKDVPVFKICNVEKDTDKVHPYFQRQQIEYKENKKYDCDSYYGFTFEYGWTDGYVVFKGMHSYSPANLRLSTTPGLPLIDVCTHKTTPQSHEVRACLQRYMTQDTAIMLCIIPKGTRYAVNSVGEVVSDSIKVVKIYIRPFTTNKDNTVSKRNMCRINKVLDNWEKGKLYDV